MPSLETQSNCSQFVTFYIGKEKFAIPVNIVREIVKQSNVTRIPLAPSYVEGIANLRGEVLPIINLRKRLKLDISNVPNARVVVISDENRTFGLVVDKTAQVIDVTEDEFKDAGAKSEFVKSVIQKNDDFYLVLDTDKLTDIGASKSEKRSSMTNSNKKSENDIVNEYVQLVTFELNNQTYAFKIEQVQEIIRYKEPIPIPNTEEYITGVIKLREDVLPIVDLKLLLSSRCSKPDNFTKVVIVKIGKSLIGFIIDKINEVLKIEKSQILPPPNVRANANEEVVGVVNLNEKMIMVLDPAKLLSDTISDLYESKEKEESVLEMEEELKYVVFKVCDTHFAVPIEEVQEINRLSKVTKIPNAPAFVEGLMNLRGEVLPVISLKKRLNLNLCAEGSKISERVLVYELTNNKKIAFIVDLVEGVEKFSKQIIEDTEQVWSENIDIIPRIIKHPEKTVLVLNLAAVLSQDEIENISSIVQSNNPEVIQKEGSQVRDNFESEEKKRTSQEKQKKLKRSK